MYVVKETESFRKDLSWLDIFGRVILKQEQMMISVTATALACAATMKKRIPGCCCLKTAIVLILVLRL